MRSLQSLLVLGGAGFLGSALVRRLLASEGVEQVVAVDLHPDDSTPGKLFHPGEDPRFGYLRVDVLNRPFLTEVIRKLSPTGVFHLAEAHPGRGDDPEQVLATNITGTANALAACRESGVPLLYASTDEVYGSIAAPERSVEDAPAAPSSPYAASKAAAELFCQAAARSRGQEVVITRGSATYGPRQADHHLLSSFVRNAVRDQALVLEGDGMQIRDWMHVDDHCDGLITTFLRGRAGESYNLGGNFERTDLGMARSVLQVLGKPESLVTATPERPALDARRACDSTKAARYFGWYPRRQFKMHFSPVIRELAGDFAG